MFYAVYRGIRNIIRWTPVIWHDEDFDGEFLMSVMEWKLRKMSKYFTDYGCHIGSDKEAREMLICAEVIKRLRAEDLSGDYFHKNYFGTDFYIKNYMLRRKALCAIFAKLLTRTQFSWWD